MTPPNPDFNLPDLLRVKPLTHASRIITWLETYLRENGYNRTVLEVSSSLNSIVTACLCSRALSSQRAVYAYVMPCRDEDLEQTQRRIESAESLREQMPDLHVQVHDITEEVALKIRTTTETAAAYGQSLRWTPQAISQIRSYVRKTHLRTMASLMDGLVVGSESYSESRIGVPSAQDHPEADVLPLHEYLDTEIVQIASALEISRKTQNQAQALLHQTRKDLDKGEFSTLELDIILSFTQQRYRLSPHTPSGFQELINAYLAIPEETRIRIGTRIEHAAPHLQAPPSAPR